MRLGTGPVCEIYNDFNVLQVSLDLDQVFATAKMVGIYEVEELGITH